MGLEDTIFPILTIFAENVSKRLMRGSQFASENGIQRVFGLKERRTRSPGRIRITTFASQSGRVRDWKIMIV